MPLKFCHWMLLLTLCTVTGCGRFVARRMAQSPNTYPTWLAPAAPVELAFDSSILTNFPDRLMEIGPPAAQLNYRVIEPMDFGLSTSSTNWLDRGRQRTTFSFHTTPPAKANEWTQSPRGTVVLLHGYGLAQFAMVPWALRLAEDGWRCVLVDLRGHGKSTGRRIYFGMKETHDLSQLLDALAADGQLTPPVSALGESYGASLALRWKSVESRLETVVAIAPYASLSNATLNLGREYARQVPQCFLKAGLRRLPALLDVEPSDLDTTTVMADSRVNALVIAGTRDKIMPVEEVRRVFEAAAPDSAFVVVPLATHEAVPYYFDELVPRVREWLVGETNASHTAGTVRMAQPDLDASAR